jgi:hypothetical protein
MDTTTKNSVMHTAQITARELRLVRYMRTMDARAKLDLMMLASRMAQLNPAAGSEDNWLTKMLISGEVAQ